MSKKRPKIHIPDTNEVDRYGSAEAAPNNEVEARPPSKNDAPETEQAPSTGEPGTEQEGEPLDEAGRLRKQVEELTDKHLRAVAELQNFRRRSSIERSESIRYATADLVKALLPVVDDLERSLAAAESQDQASLADGVKLVHQNLVKALGDHHVQRIESVGKPFDPELHQAVMRQPTDDHPPQTVLTECEAGYTLRDRVLRHAKVVVSQPTQSDSQEQDNDQQGEGPAPE